MNDLDEKLSVKNVEKAVLVGIFNRETPKEKAEEYLAELQLLTKTAGASTLKTFMQRLDKPVPATYVGKGKLQEIAEFVKDNGIDLVVFDDDLSPSQVRNIDKVLEVKVLDRSGIILHIFSESARTAQAKVQVELARLEYMLPRLTGLWTHLSKQKGGIGMKGAGEKEIETDRRNIRFRIDLLKKELQKIDKQNFTRRKKRGTMVRVSLVGYTNAGKSTLMNALSKDKAQVLAEDKLFATLDTTVRKVVFDLVPFLLSDTVGFLRKLPHNLVECFKSTLDEVRESDVLLHVVDVSHPSYLDHIQVVNETLAEIGAGEKQVLVVFNKVDQLSAEEQAQLEDTWMTRKHEAICISAYKKLNLDGLRETVVEIVRKNYKDKYPHFHLAERPDWGEY